MGKGRHSLREIVPYYTTLVDLNGNEMKIRKVFKFETSLNGV